MDVLIRFGFTIEEIKNMMDTNIEIDTIKDECLEELISILDCLGCSDIQIKNILIANPFYLNRDIEDVKELLKAVKKVGFTYLNVTFDSNPFLLNLDKDEFLGIVTKKHKEGLNDREIIDFINYELI